MENAGESTYFVIKEVFGQDPKSVTVFCGIGNNGGDGLVVARKLNSIGWNPEIILLGDTKKFQGAAKINYDIVQKLGLTLIPYDKKSDVFESLATADLIVDAIFGTGLDRNVTGDYLDCINNSWLPAGFGAGFVSGGPGPRNRPAPAGHQTGGGRQSLANDLAETGPADRVL